MESIDFDSIKDTYMVDLSGSRHLFIKEPTEEDKLLMKAAHISKILREKIMDELGYTCSTGMNINHCINLHILLINHTQILFPNILDRVNIQEYR